MDYGFSVRVSAESVSARLQSVFNFLKVVYLTVEDNGDRSIFPGNRLMAAGQIDNGKTTHSERYAFFNKSTFIIWSPVPDHLTHIAEHTPTLSTFRLNPRAP